MINNSKLVKQWFCLLCNWEWAKISICGPCGNIDFKKNPHMDPHISLIISVFLCTQILYSKQLVILEPEPEWGRGAG